MKRILQIDGGGIRGIIPAVICSALEKETGKKISDVFDLITGTSTGSIIGGALAAGVPAEWIRKLYVDDGPRLFRKRNPVLPWNWFRAKYDRTPFIEKLQGVVGSKTMADLHTRYMATAFNLCSGRTHFIKSWHDSDAAHGLVDVISWSALSAALYFGKIGVPDYQWKIYQPDGSEAPRTGAVFQDGGQGINNCTLGFDMNECMANNWDEEGVFILSLGCGSYMKTMTYRKAKKVGFFGEILDYFAQARRESTRSQVLAAEYVEKHRDNFECYRLDTQLSKKKDKLDAIGYSEEFEKIGLELAGKLPLDQLGPGLPR
ncbi:MAG: patatin [Spirochaetales bacterium]|jgi:uncharacterized protein|nr:patatin [Spirochaetales bacterium]